MVLSVARGGGAAFARKVEKTGISMKSQKFHEVPGFREISINPFLRFPEFPEFWGAPGGGPILVGTVRINWSAI